MDYKSTLNLPNTKFPMKANLAQREPEILKKWQDTYVLQQQKRSGQKKFILNDGPPYANGKIHIGHALNKILKDIIVKSKNLSGYHSPYIPGWDCHGLPIELNVEKKIGKAGHKVDHATFRQKCREYAAKQVELQKESFIRLGVLADWDNPYLTMDPQFEANIIRTLGRIIANGHLVSGDRPVHWCINCGSALAEAEVEYMEKTSPAIDVGFEVVEPELWSKVLNLAINQLSVVIWTTTPWTIPANEAISVNPNEEYAVVAINQRQILVANGLIEQVANRLNAQSYEILATTIGYNLEHLKVYHPLEARQVPIILGQHVSLDLGTGCVHTAPAHGYDDYLVGKKYELPVNNLLTAEGRFISSVEYVAGLQIFTANNVIIELLDKNKSLLSNNQLRHSYPHCWRHKTPLIFRATKQWFISMNKSQLQQLALQEITQVKWIPDWGRARIENMVKSRPDWCISRQRTWGTPIPLYVHKETGDLHPNTIEIINKVADSVAEHGIDFWFENEFINDDSYEKVTDTLDVWFDSGAVHACVAEQRDGLTTPVDLYLEGSDQHRGWFQTSLLSSVATTKKAPYNQVLTHGFTVDGQGRKMSKSLGNVVAPDQIFKTLGADILRLWVAATDYRTELNVSDEILQRISESYRRIRNTSRFLLANLHDFTPSDAIEIDKMLELDKWIINQAANLQHEIITDYDDYQFHSVYQKIHSFCVEQLGSFYLDIIKDRQYTCFKTSNARRSAQTAMYQVLQALVRWIAPILSFTAEEIWGYLPETSDSIFLADWYTGLQATEQHDSWQQLIPIRNSVNKVIEQERATGNIGSGLEAEVTLYCDEKLYKILSKLGDELRFVLITSQARLAAIKTKPDSSHATEIDGLYIDLVASSQPKCARCWHRRSDVGSVQAHPTICMRCVTNLEAPGEQRIFA